MYRFIVLFVIFLLLFAKSVFAASLSTALSGYILLDVESRGEAWYVYPKDGQRYFLGRPDDAYKIMRNLGLGISNANLAKIPVAGSASVGDYNLRRSLSGMILIQVESHGEAWYVYPKDLKRYYLGRPYDAFRIMSELGLGITNKNLSTIPKPLANGSKYEQKTIATKRGNFVIDLVTIDVSDPEARIISDTASLSDCKDDCPAKPLQDYVKSNGGFAGIQGAYFCAADYAECQDKSNYYFFPFYSQRSNTLINASEVKWLRGSILVFDQNNNSYFFPVGKDFKSMDEFEAAYKVKIQSVISNAPALIHGGVNIIDSQEMDLKQRYTKSARGGIGIKGKKVYLVEARYATVPDLAAIMEALQVDTALNLDGGGSSALYYNGQYKVGPGRPIPTALIFK